MQINTGNDNADAAFRCRIVGLDAYSLGIVDASDKDV